MLSWLKSVALFEMGGSRFWLYTSPVIALAVALVIHAAGGVLEQRADAAFREAGGVLAKSIATSIKVARIEEVNAAEMARRVAAAFADGQKVGTHSHPTVVLTGSTPVHTETGPPAVGDIQIQNKLAAAVVTIPADGKPYARADIITTVTLPKFGFSKTFTEAVKLDGAAVLDERPPCAGPIPGTPTLATAGVRTLLGIDGGLVLGATSLGYEVGGRIYPRSLALNLKYAEARLGFYGRYESTGHAAAGLSILFGVGRAK